MVERRTASAGDVKSSSKIVIKSGSSWRLVINSALKQINDSPFEELSRSAMDSHCHLDFILQKLPVVKRDKIETWQDFKKAIFKDKEDIQIGALITNFCDPRIWHIQSDVQPTLMEQLQYSSEVFYTIGCHPHWSDLFQESSFLQMQRLIEMDRLGKCVAIGECGLDFSHKNSIDVSTQKKVFKQQINLALSLKKPLVLHIRDAQAEAIEVLNELKVPSDYPVHRHCFTENWTSCSTWLKRFPNSAIGFTNLVTSGEQYLDNVLRKLTLDNIVLETDAPYFFPKGMYQKTAIPEQLKTTREKGMSHPWEVINVAAYIAAIKNLPLKSVLDANARNIERIYGIKR
eukprot:TRINITY_DN32528_c0_g1_i2.p1 TRINITY_DN32528_c0_g1~~TRINITY_DN32528_c0_g1_i2.p1  ORF type:complete len:344 (+),score=48.11 TRINITY_DN32528_c0_g1_i2:5-1036(+)